MWALHQLDCQWASNCHTQNQSLCCLMLNCRCRNTSQHCYRYSLFLSSTFCVSISLELSHLDYYNTVHAIHSNATLACAVSCTWQTSDIHPQAIWPCCYRSLGISLITNHGKRSTTNFVFKFTRYYWAMCWYSLFCCYLSYLEQLPNLNCRTTPQLLHVIFSLISVIIQIIQVQCRSQSSRRRRRFRIDRGPLRGSSSPVGTLSRLGWNPIKLAYKLAGWPAQLATGTFNQLSQPTT